MRQLGFLLLVLAGAAGVNPAAQAEGLGLDLSHPSAVPGFWNNDPGGWSVSSLYVQTAPPTPSILIEFGGFGLIGREGKLDALLEMEGAQMVLSANLKRLVITFKKKF